MAKDGQISKRRIKVLQVGEVSFRAYCFLRKSKRTFTIDNVLALVPVITKERDCYMMDYGKFPNQTNRLY